MCALPPSAGFLPSRHIRRVARREDARLGLHVHVVVDLVVEVEIRRAFRDRVAAADVLVLRVVEIHRAFLPLRLLRHPRAADEVAPPAGIRERHRRGVDDHEPAAALHERLDHLLLLRRRVRRPPARKRRSHRSSPPARRSASRVAPSTVMPRSASSVFHSARKRGCAWTSLPAILFPPRMKTRSGSA